jgi:hypothetical protein
LGAISPHLLVNQPTIFMVALANLWSELVNTIIKKVMAPLEGGPEFAPNEEVGE